MVEAIKNGDGWQVHCGNEQCPTPFTARSVAVERIKQVVRCAEMTFVHAELAQVADCTQDCTAGTAYMWTPNQMSVDRLMASVPPEIVTDLL